VGIFLALLNDYLIAEIAGSASEDLGLGLDAWRWMLFVAAIPAAAWGLGTLLIPRSPRFLVAKGLGEEAERVLRQFGEEDPAARVAEINRTMRDRDEGGSRRPARAAHRAAADLGAPGRDVSQPHPRDRAVGGRRGELDRELRRLDDLPAATGRRARVRVRPLYRGRGAFDSLRGVLRARDEGQRTRGDVALQKAKPPVVGGFFSGASRARTGDLVHAMHALSQLSYGPSPG
jgi:Sugar (and other) transporter